MAGDIAIVLTARASYAKYETILDALGEAGAPITVYACGAALLSPYGNVVGILRQHAPMVNVVEVWCQYEGSSPLVAAKTTAALTSELATHFDRDKPSVVVVMADRYEVLAAAQAAAYLNIPVAHIQGGERTGSIDDRVRDSISHLATYHFTATQMAALRVCSLVGGPENILWTGCPSIDIAKAALTDPPVKLGELSGAGPIVDPEGPFIFALQHSDTEIWEQSYVNMWETLEALKRMQRPVFLQWPNQDPGGEGICKAIRQFRDANPSFALHTLPNLPPRRFLRLIAQAECVVGNSSVGIRECSYLGVPVVNIGLRQEGRECAHNVTFAGYERTSILYAHKIAMAGERPKSSLLYGKGDAGPRIAKALMAIREGKHVGHDI